MRSAPRRSALLACAVLLLSSCSIPGSSSSSSTSMSGAPESSASSLPASVSDGRAQTARFEVGPPPGPVKPWRGEMVQQVQLVDGYATMYFVLRNTGEEPVTFLNLLYDYEPNHLYDPLVHAYWAGAAKTAQNEAFRSRSGRFFPSPAVLQPGAEGVYLMGGVPIKGAGTIGELTTNVKFCPTRGMDDVQSQALDVGQLAWSTRAGVTTVSGTLSQRGGGRRAAAPTIGVAFFDASGGFVGAVVGDKVGAPMKPGSSRGFEISGRGVRADAIASAKAWAWVR